MAAHGGCRPAKSPFGTFVDPAEIDRVFELWRDAVGTACWLRWTDADHEVWPCLRAD